MSFDFIPVCPKCGSLQVIVADMFMLQCQDCKHYGRYTTFNPGATLITRVRARLGSLSPKARFALPASVVKLLDEDIPALITELEDLREKIDSQPSGVARILPEGRYHRPKDSDTRHS